MSRYMKVTKVKTLLRQSDDLRHLDICSEDLDAEIQNILNDTDEIVHIGDFRVVGMGSGFIISQQIIYKKHEDVE